MISVESNENWKKWESLVTLFLGGMVLVNALVFWYGRGFIADGYADFSSFYTAGKLLDRGQGKKLYDQNAQWEVQQEFAYKVTIRHKPLPYIRPAFEALLFAPFSVFKYSVACFIWVTTNAFLLLFFPAFIRSSGIAHIGRFLPYFLSFSYVPVAITLLHGQDAILLLWIFALVVMRLKIQKDFQAGALMSLGLIKFHLIVPIVIVFALKRRAKFVFGFSLGALILLLISGGILGYQGAISYPAYIWHLGAMQNSGMVSTESMPNLRGLLTGWERTISLAHANWFLVVLEIIGIIFAFYSWDNKSRSDESLKLGFSITLIITILTSYYAYSYDLTLLILPYFLLSEIFLRPGLRSWPRTVFFLSLGILCSPLQWFLFFGVGHFYLLVPVLLALLLVCVQALRNIEKQLETALVS